MHQVARMTFTAVMALLPALRAAPAQQGSPDLTGVWAAKVRFGPDVRGPLLLIRSLRANAVLRWEWRPGSTSFLVWQQNRENDESFGNLRLGRDVDALFSGGASRNVVAVKASYWLSW